MNIFYKCHIKEWYRVFIKYFVFFLKIFLNSAICAAALVFFLPDMCTQFDTEGKQRKVRVRKYFKIFEKKTIFYEHPVSGGYGDSCCFALYP